MKVTQILYGLRYVTKFLNEIKIC